MTVSPIPRLLTVADVAELAQLSEWTIRQEIRAGNLRARKIRGCVRVNEADYATWSGSRAAS